MLNGMDTPFGFIFSSKSLVRLASCQSGKRLVFSIVYDFSNMLI